MENIDRNVDKHFKSALHSMMNNIMFQLFDYGLLMMDNTFRLNLFKNEIGGLSRDIEDSILKLKENDPKMNTYALVRDYLGAGRKTDGSLMIKLEELIKFVYGESAPQVDGFLSRAHKTIVTELDLHFEYAGKSTAIPTNEEDNNNEVN